MLNSIISNNYQILSVRFAYTKQKVRFAIINVNDTSSFANAIIWNYDTCGIEIKAGELWELGGQLKEHNNDVTMHVDPSICTRLQESTLKDHSNYLSEDQITQLYCKFQNYIESIEDPQAKQVIEYAVLYAQKVAADYGQFASQINYNAQTRSLAISPEILLNAPGSTTKHHCYKGGFLDHVCEMLDAAEALLALERYRSLDRDVVIGGIICHDIGKLLTYSTAPTEGPAKRTFLDLAFGHIAVGYKVFVQTCAMFEQDYKTPNSVLRHIEHIILSHHGTREWGSPCSPVSVEATLVHMIDMFSSQMSFAQMSAGSSLIFHDKFENFSNIDKKHQMSHALQLSKDSHFFSHESFDRLQDTRDSDKPQTV